MISIWSGLESNIPAGWALCDGTNGTPDLCDKFVLGSGSSYTVGDTGGETEVTLTIEQMPLHNHDERIQTASNADYQRYVLRNTTGTYSGACFADDATTYLSTNSYNKVTTMTTGENQPHNNMPPYYALCYVMKT